MFTRDLSYMVFSQNYVFAFVTTREGKLTKATEGIALKYHSTLLIWGLIYGLGSRNPRRLLEILYLGVFFHLPFIVIRIIKQPYLQQRAQNQ